MILNRDELEKNKESRILRNIDLFVEKLENSPLVSLIEESIIKANQMSKMDTTIIYLSQSEGEVELIEDLFKPKTEEFYSEKYIYPVLGKLFPNIKFQADLRDHFEKAEGGLRGLLGLKKKQGKELVLIADWS